MSLLCLRPEFVWLFIPDYLWLIWAEQKTGVQMAELYSDRMTGPRPRTESVISATSEAALQSLVQSYQSRDFFGDDFRELCPDSGQPYGTDEDMLERARVSAIPEIAQWPQTVRRNHSGQSAVPTMAILDALEWHAGHVGQPVAGKYHAYFEHHHKSWDRAAGLASFRDDVNEVFARQGLAYEMGRDGRISRIIAGPVAEELRYTLFDSGDAETDKLLDLARSRFFDRDPDAAQRALEALWDAFERLKTHVNPADKKTSAEALLEKATMDDMEKDLLREEMRDLTAIGNKWRIRHHEKGKHGLGEDRRLRDYLFLRMFALLHRIIPERRPAMPKPPHSFFS